jgi:acyl carrier protein
MADISKYNKAFMEALDVKEDQLADLKYQDVPTWDSVGHMGLISELEDAFDIQFETDDIVEFNSFEKGIEILKKYDVEI